MIILRRCELKQKLFDLFIDWVVSQQLEVGRLVGLFCEDFTKIMKRIEGFILQAFMYFLEDISII